MAKKKVVTYTYSDIYNAQQDLHKNYGSTIERIKREHKLELEQRHKKHVDTLKGIATALSSLSLQYQSEKFLDHGSPFNTIGAKIAALEDFDKRVGLTSWYNKAVAEEEALKEG